MTRLPQYLRYHEESMRIGDVDPSYRMLLYVCDRFELNLEQRYWLAWLYAMTYCGASAFYLYNEFPDYENVDIGRMCRWWDARGRDEIVCTTDRRWVKSSSMFVPAFESYRSWLSGRSQHDHFSQWSSLTTPEKRYDALYEASRHMYSFGRFALFLYLEALHTITPVDLCPTDLDLENAWSCRYGLYYAYGLDELVRDEASTIPADRIEQTQNIWQDLRSTLSQLDKSPTVWQTETLLCAFRKWHRGKRYIGYYLDRQALEIALMEEHVPNGVDWSVLWQHRSETYDLSDLAELDGMRGRKLTSAWKRDRESRTREIVG